MRFSTLSKSGVLRSVALAAICSLGFAASAQTFIEGGVIYKVNKGKLEVQPTKYTSGKNKGLPVECENGVAPENYEGDIVIPESVTYNGKTYQVSTVGSGFKTSLITSLSIPDGLGIKIGRGGLQDCAELVSVKLPNDLATIEGNTFQGCAKLASITIPGTVTSVGSAAFQGCDALETIVFEESATPIKIVREAFNAAPVVKTLTINRQLPTDGTQDTRPFRGCKNLETLVVGGSFTTISPNEFENTSALKNVTLAATVSEIGYNAFANSGIEEIVLPDAYTSVANSLFQNCASLRKVTLGNAVTSIQAMAFTNSGLVEINQPATLTSIGNLAFSNTKLAGEFAVAEGVTSLGDQALANCEGLTSVVIPASVKSIGTGAFMNSLNIAKFEVAAENEFYTAAADGSYITTKDGKTLVAYAPAATHTEFTGDYEAVADYAFYGAKNLTKVELPACTNWGNYALYGSGIKALSIAGTVGRYLAANCPALAELNVNCTTVPTGVTCDCPELTKVTLREDLTIVRQDAFKNCAKLESLNLGKMLVILESDCFAGSGVKTLTVASFYPAAMADGVFTAESGITAIVPVDVVDAYKVANGWSLLTIQGDANLVAGGTQLGMPAGMYYSGDDDQLHCVYADGGTDDYIIDMKHTFQLCQFNNRIYGASAGAKFWYSASSGTEGDGKLFYISQVDGNIFSAVVLDNAGNNAYKDPTGLYLYDGYLYVNDRNVCIRKISADALALPQDYPSWLENNWMEFYGPTWVYGCIKNGFAITTADNGKPLYWVGMKYNGEGIFTFQDNNIGTSTSDVGVGGNAYLTGIGLIATSFAVDEKNGHLYMYIEKAGASEESQIRGGLYRISIDAMIQNPTPTAANFMESLEAILVDGSPVLYEGNATNEHVGISQLTIDENGEYMYWCYRAPTPEQAAAQEEQDYATQGKGKYWWADKYDEANPLHHSGIKRIKLGEEEPVVEMVVPGVTGYGVVPFNYEGSKKPDGVESPVVEAAVNAIAVVNGEIVANEAATVVIYNAAGAIVDMAELAAGQSMSTVDLAAGLYLVEGRTAAGSQTVKMVK